jgi:cytochrome c5
MNTRHFLPVVLIAVVALIPLQRKLQAQSQSPPKPATAGNKQAAAAQPAKQHDDEGERIFNQNCSRCHTAPEGFSPHISGTIVRHMRVRASLSEHDEQALLRFFNP